MIFKKLAELNFLFLIVIILLSIIGFFALYAAADGNFEPWATKHIIRFFISFIILIAIAFINVKFFYKHAYTFFLVSLLLLVSVEISGTFGLGAKRWIRIFGISIQPSEFIKVAMILALSRYYHDLKFIRINNIVNLIIPLFIIFIPFFFILIQPDLGTSIMILLLGLSIMFVAGVKLWKFFLGFIISLITMPLIWRNLEHYQQRRIMTFINPESDPMGAGYHLMQSKIALGSGGTTGKGYLKGTQSYLEYLPEKTN